MLADIRKDLIRKVLKRMFIVVLVIILLWLTAVGTVWLVSIAENGGEIPLNTDAIIVLGAQVLPNGQPNRILKTRLDMAQSVYEKAPPHRTGAFFRAKKERLGGRPVSDHGLVSAVRRLPSAYPAEWQRTTRRSARRPRRPSRRAWCGRSRRPR